MTLLIFFLYHHDHVPFESFVTHAKAFVKGKTGKLGNTLTLTCDLECSLPYIYYYIIGGPVVL